MYAQSQTRTHSRRCRRHFCCILTYDDLFSHYYYNTTVTSLIYSQAVRDVQGRTLKPFLYWLALAGNLGLQAIGSLFSHLVATWFGPVSVVVPIYYAATLLSNMFIFGIVLGKRKKGYYFNNKVMLCIGKKGAMPPKFTRLWVQPEIGSYS